MHSTATATAQIGLSPASDRARGASVSGRLPYLQHCTATATAQCCLRTAPAAGVVHSNTSAPLLSFASVQHQAAPAARLQHSTATAAAIERAFGAELGIRRRRGLPQAQQPPVDSRGQRTVSVASARHQAASAARLQHCTATAAAIERASSAELGVRRRRALPQAAQPPVDSRCQRVRLLAPAGHCRERTSVRPPCLQQCKL